MEIILDSQRTVYSVKTPKTSADVIKKWNICPKLPMWCVWGEQKKESTC